VVAVTCKNIVSLMRTQECQMLFLKKLVSRCVGMAGVGNGGRDDDDGGDDDDFNNVKSTS
jgi:hypothetical protein